MFFVSILTMSKFDLKLRTIRIIDRISNFTTTARWQ